MGKMSNLRPFSISDGWVCSTHQPHNFCTQTPRAEQYFEKNNPEKWKKRIPFFPDIAVENGPFEDLVPNGSRKKKTSKKTLDHKTRHILGWIDLTRSFPTSRPQELKDRKKNMTTFHTPNFSPTALAMGS